MTNTNFINKLYQRYSEYGVSKNDIKKMQERGFIINDEAYLDIYLEREENFLSKHRKYIETASLLTDFELFDALKQKYSEFANRISGPNFLNELAEKGELRKKEGPHGEKPECVEFSNYSDKVLQANAVTESKTDVRSLMSSISNKVSHIYLFSPDLINNDWNLIVKEYIASKEKEQEEAEEALEERNTRDEEDEGEEEKPKAKEEEKEEENKKQEQRQSKPGKGKKDQKQQKPQKPSVRIPLQDGSYISVSPTSYSEQNYPSSYNSDTEAARMQAAMASYDFLNDTTKIMSKSALCDIVDYVANNYSHDGQRGNIEVEWHGSDNTSKVLWNTETGEGNMGAFQEKYYDSVDPFHVQDYNTPTNSDREIKYAIGAIDKKDFKPEDFSVHTSEDGKTSVVWNAPQDVSIHPDVYEKAQEYARDHFVSQQTETAAKPYTYEEAQKLYSDKQQVDPARMNATTDSSAMASLSSAAESYGFNRAVTYEDLQNAKDQYAGKTIERAYAAQTYAASYGQSPSWESAVEAKKYGTIDEREKAIRKRYEEMSQSGNYSAPTSYAPHSYPDPRSQNKNYQYTETPNDISSHKRGQMSFYVGMPNTDGSGYIALSVQSVYRYAVEHPMVPEQKSDGYTRASSYDLASKVEAYTSLQSKPEQPHSSYKPTQAASQQTPQSQYAAPLVAQSVFTDAAGRSYSLYDETVFRQSEQQKSQYQPAFNSDKTFQSFSQKYGEYISAAENKTSGTVFTSERRSHQQSAKTNIYGSTETITGGSIYGSVSQPLSMQSPKDTNTNRGGTSFAIKEAILRNQAGGASVQTIATETATRTKTDDLKGVFNDSGRKLSSTDISNAGNADTAIFTLKSVGPAGNVLISTITTNGEGFSIRENDSGEESEIFTRFFNGKKDEVVGNEKTRQMFSIAEANEKAREVISLHVTSNGVKLGIDPVWLANNSRELNHTLQSYHINKNGEAVTGLKTQVLDILNKAQKEDAVKDIRTLIKEKTVGKADEKISIHPNLTKQLKEQKVREKIRKRGNLKVSDVAFDALSGFSLTSGTAFAAGKALMGGNLLGTAKHLAVQGRNEIEVNKAFLRKMLPDEGIVRLTDKDGKEKFGAFGKPLFADIRSNKGRREAIGEITKQIRASAFLKGRGVERMNARQLQEFLNKNKGMMSADDERIVLYLIALKGSATGSLKGIDGVALLNQKYQTLNLDGKIAVKGKLRNLNLNNAQDVQTLIEQISTKTGLVNGHRLDGMSTKQLQNLLKKGNLTKEQKEAIKATLELRNLQQTQTIEIGDTVRRMATSFLSGTAMGVGFGTVINGISKTKKYTKEIAKVTRQMNMVVKRLRRKANRIMARIGRKKNGIVGRFNRTKIGKALHKHNTRVARNCKSRS